MINETIKQQIEKYLKGKPMLREDMEKELSIAVAAKSLDLALNALSDKEKSEIKEKNLDMPELFEHVVEITSPDKMAEYIEKSTEDSFEEFYSQLKLSKVTS